MFGSKMTSSAGKQTVSVPVHVPDPAAVLVESKIEPPQLVAPLVRLHDNGYVHFFGFQLVGVPQKLAYRKARVRMAAYDYVDSGNSRRYRPHKKWRTRRASR